MNRRWVITSVLTLLLFAPTLSFALGLVAVVPPECNTNPGGCQSICDLAQLGQNALTDGIYIAIFLSAILFAWAGWNMVVGSSSGNVTQVTKAKNIFKYVTGGLVLILAAWIIVSVIMAALTNNCLLYTS